MMQYPRNFMEIGFIYDDELLLQKGLSDTDKY